MWTDSTFVLHSLRGTKPFEIRPVLKTWKNHVEEKSAAEASGKNYVFRPGAHRGASDEVYNSPSKSCQIYIGAYQRYLPGFWTTATYELWQPENKEEAEKNILGLCKSEECRSDVRFLNIKYFSKLI